VAEQFTGIPGKFVKLEETLSSFDRLCAGEFDHLPAQAFFMCGGVEDLMAVREASPGAIMLIDLAYTEFADEDLTSQAIALPCSHY